MKSYVEGYITNYPINTFIQVICPGHMISIGFYQEPTKFGRMHLHVKQWNGIFFI